MKRSKLAIELDRLVAAGIVSEGAARRKLQDFASGVEDALPDDNAVAVEEEAFKELREMRRQQVAERDALVAQVRDDLLAGRIGRSTAVERVGLRGWTEICASLDDEVLRRVLGGDE